MVITISHQGYIKRNPLSAYRSQRRGGKGLIGMETKEEDFVEQLFIGSTHDYMLFFSNLGRLYWLKTYQLPEAGRAAKGKALINLLQLSEGERIATALPVRDFKAGFLVMFTKNGTVKKTALEEYSNPRGKGIIAVTIEEGDELIAVKRQTARVISLSAQRAAFQSALMKRMSARWGGLQRELLEYVLQKEMRLSQRKSPRKEQRC